MKSLIELEEGKSGIFKTVGEHMRVKKRLADLGITPGVKIKVLRKSFLYGPVEISIQDSKLVLGRGLAQKIMVEESE